VQKLSMNDAVKYSVMVVLGPTVHEYAAEACRCSAGLPEGSSLADKLVMVGPGPTMTKK
jgi:hypothetical protein